MTLPRGAAAGSDPPAHRPAPVQAHADQDDRTLVSLVCASDATALEALYVRYGRICYSLARRILTDEQLAQDVVQEVFLAVWRDAGRFDASRGGFSTWLLSMTHHKAVDSVRREENLRKRRTTADVLETQESDAPKVDEAVWSLVRRERVREALKSLPGPQREALALAYFGGYTQREIAGLTATPLGTVKTRMLAGMRRMKESLDGLSNAAGGREPPGGWTPATDPRGTP